MINKQLTQLWKFFETEVFSIPSSNSPPYPLFNPYHDTSPNVERKDSAKIRRQNLYNYLSSFHGRPSILVLGEAPGWRGCRFSGVPFTSEALLAEDGLSFSGIPTSLRNQPYPEASATIFWRVMKKYHPTFLVWNCLPYHPHHPGKPLSNRRPSKTELSAHLPLLRELIELLSPENIIAVGRCAYQALGELDISSNYVRHPSHGGTLEFKAGIERIMSAD